MSSLLSRRLSKDLLLYGAGDAATKGLLFLALPLYTRVFSPPEYGVLSLLLTILSLLVSILLLGLDSAYALHYFEAKTDHERRELTSTVVAGLTAVAVTFSLALIPLAPLISRLLFQSSGRSALVVLALLSAPPYLINRMLGQVLRSQFRAATLSILNITTSVLSVSIGVVAILFFDAGINGVILGTAIGEALSVPVRLYLVRAGLVPVFRRTQWSKVLRFGLPLIPTSIAYWIFLASDRLLLSRLSDFQEVGLYSVANAEVALLLLVAGIIGGAWNPHALQMYNEDPGRAAVVFGRFLTYILAFMGSLAVLFATFAPELVRLFAGPEFHAAEKAVPPLVIAIVAYGTTYVTAMGIGMKKRIRFLALYSLYTAGLNVALCFLLIPPFGQLGAAWSTTVSYVALTLMYLRKSQQLWPVHYEVRRSLTLVALIVGFCVVAPWLPEGSLVRVIPIKLLYSLCFAGFIILLRALDRRDLTMMRSLFRGRSLPVDEVRPTAPDHDSAG